MSSYEVVQMTRELAERLLGVNEHNRHLRPSGIERWKGTFLRGEYRDTGEPIKVRGTVRSPRRLQDGQHRLAGFLAASDERPSLTVKMVVAEGIADDAQIVIDTGMKRSLADILAWREEPSPTLLASIIGLSLRVTKGRLIGTGGLFTHPELLAHFDERPWLRDGLTPGRRIIGEFRVSPTGCCYALALAASVGGEGMADEFADLVTHGDRLERGHPVLRLRDQYIEWMRTRPGAGAGPLAHVVAASTVNAWNRWRAGDVSVPPSWVRWQGGDFPEPQ